MSKENPIIMVVEDEELLLKAITKKLDLNNVRTVSCTSGKQALDYLQNMVETTDLPDAIWLDYHLKDMDGLAFLTGVKENSKLKDIPVIVISNSASPEKVQTMLALGANKYLLKAEYRLEDLVDEVKVFIKEDNNGK